LLNFAQNNPIDVQDFFIKDEVVEGGQSMLQIIWLMFLNTDSESLQMSIMALLKQCINPLAFSSSSVLFSK